MRRVWFVSPLGFKWPDEASQCVSDWCRDLLLNAPLEVGEILAATCYHIWRARNSLCFDDKHTSELDVVSRAMESLFSYQQSQHQLQQGVSGVAVRMHQQWVAPPNQFVKISVDASGMGSSWGLAAVIRNHYGNVVAAATRVLTAGFGAEYAEACALKFGLEFALSHGFLSVIVESDCKRVVDAVLHKSSNSTYQGYVMQDISSLSNSFLSFSIVHISRNANMVAHHLS